MQNLEPRDDKHYRLCDAYNEVSLTEVCICDRLEAAKVRASVDSILRKRRKDEGHDFGDLDF
jgi:hypothetical protein